MFPKLLGTVNTPVLQKDVTNLLDQIDGWHYDQISLTSPTGNDEWLCSTGRIVDLKFPEKYYSTINKSLEGTYIHTLINQYKDYYRWRLLHLHAMSTYTVHCDSLSDKQNLRLHIPVWTNKDCYLSFYSDKVEDGKELSVTNHHLAESNVYEINTTSWHSAVNYSGESRWHIVGVRYE